MNSSVIDRWIRKQIFNKEEEVAFLGHKDFLDLKKQIVKDLDKIGAFDKTEKLLDRTEKDRMRLHNENQELKKELGKLLVVKRLMDNAEVYAYSDLLLEKDVIVEQKACTNLNHRGVKCGSLNVITGLTYLCDKCRNVEKSEVKEKKL